LSGPNSFRKSGLLRFVHFFQLGDRQFKLNRSRVVSHFVSVLRTGEDNQHRILLICPLFQIIRTHDSTTAMFDIPDQTDGDLFDLNSSDVSAKAIGAKKE